MANLINMDCFIKNAADIFNSRIADRRRIETHWLQYNNML